MTIVHLLLSSLHYSIKRERAIAPYRWEEIPHPSYRALARDPNLGVKFNRAPGDGESRMV